ncbi:hypothetical protein QVD17_09671 [Tagetes erecta]|uniref:Uncharacterized protein n=1 Tax=Tagetes erecta TaxID=13708 RepID=A0AAD8L535_TARER|nr:hypothetical protein QVD17_09671 [Tagetes erecta]
MQHQGHENNDLGYCLSFDCYFSDSITASAAAKVICELKHEQQAAPQLYHHVDEDVDHFEFNLDSSSDQQIAFVSDTNTMVKEANNAYCVSNQLQECFVDEHEAAESYDSKPSGIFCLWRSKTGVESSSSSLAKCKNNGSGSHGSNRWKSIFLFGSKKTQTSKLICQFVKTEEVAKVGKVKTGKSSLSSSGHELFYVQKRAERKGDKLKSFLPYKQDLLGFFVVINRFRNKKLLF